MRVIYRRWLRPLCWWQGGHWVTCFDSRAGWRCVRCGHVVQTIAAAG